MASALRRERYKTSDLPNSFSYKIRNAFMGKPCPVCGKRMYYGEFGTTLNFPSIQHNKPISKGGRHELGNISVICKRCNVSLRDTETGELNSKEVAEEWEKIRGESK